MKAHINPEILCWARQEAGLSLEEAAQLAGIQNTKKQTPAERLTKWESGEDTPTRNQAADLAKAYYRPILTFYMKTPPRPSMQVPDFRSITSHPDPQGGNRLAAFVRQMIARQREVAELLVDDAEDVKTLPFIGRYSVDTDLLIVVNDIRRELGFDFETQRNLHDRDDLFRILRKHVEKRGVFVILQGNLGSYHTNIDAEEFRGIALTDSVAPFIIINNNDAKAAYSFTLLHELAHLWLGESGISNISPFSAEEKGERLESVCNNIAAEFLMPKTPFEEMWLHHQGEQIAQSVAMMAKEFKVSQAAAANRLWKLGYIEDTVWWSLYRSYQDLWRRNREKLKEQDGGPGYYTLQQSRLGVAIINTVLGAVDAGELTYTRASRILGVNAKSFEGLRG